MNEIVYFDAAASFLKPESVIEAQADFLRNHYANAGRGVCSRATAVDDMVAHVRQRVSNFINASANQVVFTSNATDGLNRVANIILQNCGNSRNLSVAVSDLEHHSARLPWQELARGGKIQELVVYELDENFNVNADLIPKTDVLVVTAMSNVLGIPQDVALIVAKVRAKNPNVIVVVDATQYVVHKKIDVLDWGADFVVFSGHKIGADTGVGVLYIKDAEKYMPDKFGGGMVSRVLYDGELILQSSPDKWEAGTLPLTQICGLNVAIQELEAHRPDLKLVKYIYDELQTVQRIKILTSRDAALFLFVVDGMHVLDFGTLAGANGICLRVGNMCASWIHKALGVDGSIRVSVGPWNTMSDADKFISVVKKIVK